MPIRLLADPIETICGRDLDEKIQSRLPQLAKLNLYDASISALTMHGEEVLNMLKTGNFRAEDIPDDISPAEMREILEVFQVSPAEEELTQRLRASIQNALQNQEPFSDLE